MTTVPPINASAPVPRLIWAMSRTISLRVVDECIDGMSATRLRVERRLLADSVPPARRARGRPRQAREALTDRAHCAHHAPTKPTAVAMMLMTNSAMNE